MKWTLTLTAALLLVACTATTERAKKTLEARQTLKNEVEYRNLQTFPGGVVCGEFNSGYDVMNRRTGYRRFIVRGEMVLQGPSEDDWSVFCSRDQAAALQARLGIGILGEERGNLQKIRKDISELQLALIQYRTDNVALPTPDQGLAALTSPSKVPPAPRRFREGGYMLELPVDPWGRPYLYEISEWGGIAKSFRIYSLGADGTSGGQGENVDIGTEDLKYLNLIES